MANLSKTYNTDGWLRIITDLRNRLQQLNEHSESEFLGVGTQMQQIYSQAKYISETCASIAQSLTGNEVRETVEGLRSLLDNVQSYSAHAEKLARKGETDLKEIFQLIRRISGPVRGFKNIVRTLNILGVFTRIENASLLTSSSDIHILANEVSKLAEVIDGKSGGMAAKLEQLYHLIHATLTTIEQIEAAAHEKAIVILGKTRDSLSAFAGKQEASHAAMQTIAHHSDEIRKKMGAVVSSIQFHDITRQQLEHAIEALDKLAQKFVHDLQTAADTDAQKDAVQYLGDVSELQRAQVEQSQRSIVDAVQDMFASLTTIADRTADFSSEIHSLTGTRDSIDASFLSEIEDDIRTISDSMMSTVKASTDIAKATISVADMVSEMAGFLSEIEDIGKEIELIAVNAIVKASHIGNEGAALRVSAQSIETLSVQSRKDIATVAKVLRQISEAAADLKTSMEAGANDREKALNGMVQEINHLLKSMQDVNTQVANSLRSTDENAELLRQQIKTSIAKFKTHKLFEKVLAQVAGGLHHIAREAYAGVGQNAAGRTQRLRDLEASYTMHSERHVHKSLLQLQKQEQEAVAPMASEVPGSSAADELGDNIELF